MGDQEKSEGSGCNLRFSAARCKFIIGDRVWKRSGDYTFEGTVIVVFEKLSGVRRLIVEDDRGMLLIFNERQLDLKCESVGCEGAICHAENVYSRVRYWCADHVPTSGHHESCPEPCKFLVDAAMSRMLP